MMPLKLALPDYKLFPYERHLAEREIETLQLTILHRDEDHFLIEPPRQPSRLRRLTYVWSVGANGHSFSTDIARFETVHRERRGRTAPRQATRYHLHGLHEYKGKFNPQVVRAFANLLEVREGDWLIDPFCGSGTALVEGLAIGGNTLGIDRNPLAVFITHAKLAAWRTARAEDLSRRLSRWIDEASPRIERAQTTARRSRAGVAHLDHDSLGYLESWFDASALAALSVALETASRLDRCAARLLAKLAISDIARAASLQLPEDLRVRRRSPDDPVPAVLPLLQEAATNIIAALDELAMFPSRPRLTSLVVEGSASDPRSYRRLVRSSKRAAVVTSPPYAMALPYIDTDRLSLVLLGLCPSSHLRRLEQALYGSREWTTKEHAAWEERLRATTQTLPADVVRLCRRVLDSTQPDDGFRRRATPGLLMRYFVSMQGSLVALRASLRRGEQGVFIVGENKTRADEDTITINTPELLGSTAETAGFEVREILPLETWPRFGLHHTNGIASESAVWLRAN